MISKHFQLKHCRHILVCADVLWHCGLVGTEHLRIRAPLQLAGWTFSVWMTRLPAQSSRHISAPTPWKSHGAYIRVALHALRVEGDRRSLELEDRKDGRF